MKENLLMLLNNSYSPLSNYKTACIIICNNGQEFIGVNVENPSSKSGLCAEQVALSSAITDGYGKEDFKEIHVMGSGNEYCMPCFLCRELLYEFFKENVKVFCYNKKGKVKEFLVKDLCPYPFELEDSNGK